jgi:hypothetical protein
MSHEDRLWFRARYGWDPEDLFRPNPLYEIAVKADTPKGKRVYWTAWKKIDHSQRQIA